MGEFMGAVLRFPTVLFTFLLVVVIGYWLLVLLGAVDLDADAGAGLDGAADAGAAVDGGAGASGGFPGMLAGLGLGGVPTTVVVSLMIAVAWFTSLAGSVLLAGISGSPWVLVALSVGVLVAALVVAWLIAWLVALPLRFFFPLGPRSSRNDFVGGVCVIRTGTVTADFGQAEATSADGSSAVIQVRQAGNDPLSAGSTAVIYDYDAKGEFFWVMPVDAALGPNP